MKVSKEIKCIVEDNKLAQHQERNEADRLVRFHGLLPGVVREGGDEEPHGLLHLVALRGLPAEEHPRVGRLGDARAAVAGRLGSLDEARLRTCSSPHGWGNRLKDVQEEERKQITENVTG